MDAIKVLGPDEYEGLMTPYGGPANGKDLTGTYFAAKGDPSWPAGTDFCLDWNPGGEYPLLYGHGLDGAIKASVVGRWSFKSWDDKGGWAKLQLDKAHEYHDEIASLVEQGALKLSSGAVDHLYQKDDKTGAIKLWPLVEGSLTPIPANPDQPPVGYAVKSLDATEHLAVLGVVMPSIKKEMDKAVGGGVDRDKIPAEDFAGPNRSFPIVTAGDVSDAASSLGRAKGDTAPIKAKIIAIAKRKGFESSLPKAWTDDGGKSLAFKAWDQAASDAAAGASLLAGLYQLIGEEAGEADQLAVLQDAADAVAKWIDMEKGEIGTEVGDEAAMLSRDRAIKAGARNSQTDQSHIDAAHDHLVAAHAHLVAAGATTHSDSEQSDAPPPPEDTAPDSGKSLDTQPTPGLAVKAGTDAVRMSDADLAALKQTIVEFARAEAHKILAP